MKEKPPTQVIAVHGAIDSQSRCAHYRSPTDVVAIRMKCCGVYYACKDCHIELAGHPIVVWPQREWDELAILCGICRTELSINEYMQSGSRCPRCSASFNPNCHHHFRFYFET